MSENLPIGNHCADLTQPSAEHQPVTSPENEPLLYGERAYICKYCGCLYVTEIAPHELTGE